MMINLTTRHECVELKAPFWLSFSPLTGKYDSLPKLSRVLFTIVPCLPNRSAFPAPDRYPLKSNAYY